jgi:hypothetical protein
MDYNHPNYLIIRDRQMMPGSISAAGLESAYIGSSLKVYTKAVVLGVSFRTLSASALASVSMRVSRVESAGTLSTWQSYTILVSAGAKWDISLASGMTLDDIRQAAALACSAASLDKVPVLSDIIWRYRYLPDDTQFSNATLG